MMPQFTDEKDAEHYMCWTASYHASNIEEGTI